MWTRFCRALICLLAATIVACAGQFREPIQLTPNKTVDVVGLHWQIFKTLGRPAQELYIITYVTKLPFDRATVSPEADQVMQHFSRTINPSDNMVVVQAITEPTGGFIKQYRSYNFAYVRTAHGWVPRR